MTATPRSRRASSNEVPQVGSITAPTTSSEAWRVPADGALCRPLSSTRSPGCSRPGVRAGLLAGSRVICAPNVRVLSRANAPQIPRETRVLFHDYVRRNIGHYMARAEPCSASSRLSPRTINRFDRACLVRSARSTSSHALPRRRHATHPRSSSWTRRRDDGALRAHSPASRSESSLQGCPWSTSNMPI